MVGLFNSKRRTGGQESAGNARTLLRRASRRVLFGLLWGLGGVVFLLAVVLLVAPLRGTLLGWGVRLADGALPGTLSAGKWEWPSLDHLVLKDVLWLDGTAVAPGDTLADLAHLDLKLDLGALRSRDGRVEAVDLDIRNLDVPAIRSATANMGGTAAPDTLEPEAVKGEFPFLHAGGIPGLPAATLDRLHLEIDRLVLDPRRELRDLVLTGRADLGRGRIPSVTLQHGSGRYLAAVGDTAGAPVWEWEVEHLGLGLELLVGRDETGALALGRADLDSLNVVIAPLRGTAPPEILRASEEVILKAGGDVRKAGENFTGQLEIDFVLPGSAHFHPWLPADFPHDEFNAVSGQLELSGELAGSLAAVDLHLDLGSSNWLEKGLVIGRAEADLDALRTGELGQIAAHLDTLDVNLKGICMEGRGDWGPGDASVELDVACSDFRLPVLFALAADPGLADVLQDADRMRLDAAVRLQRTEGRYSGRFDGDFELPGTAAAAAWLPADFPHDEFDSAAGNLKLAGDLAGTMAGADLRLDLNSGIGLEKGLVSGRVEGNIQDLRSGDMGNITARVDTLDIKLQGIQIQGRGDWGPKDAGVELDVACSDFRLPVLFGLAAEPGLAEVLQDTDRMRLDAAVRLQLTEGRYSGRFDGDFELPGTAAAAAWLPVEFPHEEFETVNGRIDASGHYDAPRAGGYLRFDFSDNDWAEKGLIAAAAELDLEDLKVRGLPALTARLDTCEIDAGGILLAASGALEPGTLMLDIEGELNDFSLPRLFAGPEFAETDATLVLDAKVAGSLEEPEVDAKVGGSFHRDGLAVPSFAVSLAGDRRNVAVVLRAGGGLEFESVRLDSVSARVQGEMSGRDSLSAGFGLTAWEGPNQLALGGSVRGDTVRVVQLDSLVMKTFGQELRTVVPATLTLGPEPGIFELTELEFRGDPGRIFAKGHQNTEGMDLDAVVDLLLREKTLQELMPSPLWSRAGGSDLKIDVTADLEHGPDDPRVKGRAQAVLLPHRDDPSLGVDLQFTSQGGENAVLKADFALNSADTVLLKARLDWPGVAGPEKGFWRPDPGQDMVFSVPAQKMNLSRINQRMPSETVFRGMVDVVGEARIFPPGDKEKALADSLGGVRLQGSVDAALGVPRLRVDLPNRSWLETVVDVKVDGSLADPRVGAKVDVTSGFIRLPEIPRNLHPVEGPALLWALNDSLLARMDTTAGAAAGDSLRIFRNPEPAGPPLTPTGPAVMPDMDVEVVISNDLRIVGYSLDVKLLGGVKVVRGYDKDQLPGPSVKGELTVREGSLKVMNRVFAVERGNIRFTGDVPPNPDFNLMLESQVNAYLVRILISGRAAAPVIELTCEPDLSEEDVMAVLLFGQPLGDLDNDQRGRMDEENDPNRELQKNLAGLAMALGTKGLQDTMSDSFGVDMVQMGSDSSGGSTLMVGKFITPDIMLKYHQSLEKSGTYFMTLEYSLTRFFKVISTYGQGEEASGAELKWSRRY